MKALLRRIRLLLRYRRWALVNPPYGLAIRDEDTPDVEAKILALKGRFADMSPDAIGDFFNTKSSTLIAAAKDWGLS